MATVLTAVASVDAGGRGRGHRDTDGPTLLARATLSADFLGPRPAVRRAGHPGERPQRPVPGPGHPRLLGHGRQRRRHVLGDAGQRLRHARPTRPTSCCACTASRRTGRRPTAVPGRSTSATSSRCATPTGSIPFPIVNGATPERLLTGADFDIESVVRAAGRQLLDRRGVRPVPAPRRRDRQGARRAVRVPRRQVARQPVPAARRDAAGPRQPRVRGDGGIARTGAASTRSSRARSPTTRSPAPPRDLRVRHPRRQLHRPHLGVRDRHRRQRHRRRLHGRQRSRCSLIERDDFEGPASVTKRAVRGRPRAAPTPTASCARSSSSTCCASPTRPPSARPPRRAPTASATRSPFPCSPFEVVLPARATARLLVGNDNNYPGSNGRVARHPRRHRDDHHRRRRRPRAARRRRHSSSATAAPAATAPSTRSPPTRRRSCSAPTSSSPTSCRPRTACSSPGTRTRSAGRPTSPPSPSSPTGARRRRSTASPITGWFTEDFTLAELRTLRAKERHPGRPPGEHGVRRAATEIPTFDEVLDLARHSRTCDGGPVGVYPETKHPTYFDSIGLSLEEPLVAASCTPTATDGRRAPVFIQSFETGNLRELDRLTDAAARPARQLHRARRTTSSPPATRARTPTW